VPSTTTTWGNPTSTSSDDAHPLLPHTHVSPPESASAPPLFAPMPSDSPYQLTTPALPRPLKARPRRRHLETGRGATPCTQHRCFDVGCAARRGHRADRQPRGRPAVPPPFPRSAHSVPSGRGSGRGFERTPRARAGPRMASRAGPRTVSLSRGPRGEPACRRESRGPGPGRLRLAGPGTGPVPGTFGEFQGQR
jgi:hypothetical protein